MNEIIVYLKNQILDTTSHIDRAVITEMSNMAHLNLRTELDNLCNKIYEGNDASPHLKIIAGWIQILLIDRMMYNQLFDSITYTTQK